MKQHTPSRTAQYMAFFRAVETARPKHKRLFADPYAVRFLDKKLQRVVWLSSLPVIGTLVLKLVQRRAPGALSSGIARTAYIDDLLKASVAAGARQLVILGAGFDTRFLRLGAVKSIPVIEIDHPATSNFKQTVLRQTLEPLPPNTAFHQTDFNQRFLTQVAEEAKIEFSLPTVLLWEGVSNYLTAEAVADVFVFTQNFVSPFTIVFTYVDEEVLLHPSRFKEAKALFQNLKENDEQWTFGFDPKTLAGFLKTYGLSLKKDLHATAYRERYLPERKSGNEGYAFYHVAVAER